jgi:hypothetical protein
MEYQHVILPRLDIHTDAYNYNCMNLIRLKPQEKDDDVDNYIIFGIPGYGQKEIIIILEKFHFIYIDDKKKDLRG